MCREHCGILRRLSGSSAGCGTGRKGSRLLITTWVTAWVAAWTGVAGAADLASVERTTDAKVTAKEPLSPHLQGAPNFRDIGGYVTKDGRHVRWGQVFRSGELSHLTPLDREKLDDLSLVSVVDLRAQDERDQAPSLWGHRPDDLYESPKLTIAPVMKKLLQDTPSAEALKKKMEIVYSETITNYRAEYSELFHRVAAGKLPILVNCTAGKDRTGVAIALLLSAVDVPRSTVMADYELTEKLVPPNPAQKRSAPVGGAAKAGFADLPAASRNALWRADPAYLTAALDAVDREYGSIHGYMRRALGLSDTEIRALRSALTE